MSWFDDDERDPSSQTPPRDRSRLPDLGDLDPAEPGRRAGRRPPPSEPQAPSRPEPAPARRPEPARRREREQGRRGRSRGSETPIRVLVALPWIAFAIAVTIIGGWIFAVAMAALAAVCSHELFGMTARARPLIGAGIAWTAGLVLIAHASDRPAFHLVLGAAAGFLVLFGAALSRGEQRNLTYSMATTVFGVAWIAIPFVHAVLLRDLDPHGAALVVSVAIGTFASDTAAYFGGRSFGTRHITPRISPGKTLEGLIFGIAGGTAAVFFAGLYQDWMSAGESLVLGLAIALAAPLGDLFESMVKRDLDAKDSGKLLGPHGGLLDRLDAILFTMVVGYYVALAYGGFAG